MPIVNGACIPAACFRAEFDGTNASLMQGPTSAGRGTTDVSDLYPDMLKDWKQAMRKPAVLECDDCRCHHGPFSPWGPGNPTPLKKFVDDGTEYTIYGEGAQVRWWIGFCLPQPTAGKAAGPRGGGGGKKKRPGRPAKSARVRRRRSSARLSRRG